MSLLSRARIGIERISRIFDQKRMAIDSDNLCYIVEGITYSDFGFYINFPEKEWIISEIKNFLES